jgi:hypothetical protein
VAYNYNDNYWITGNLSRTAGVPRGIFKHPLLISTNKTVYEHEKDGSLSYDGADVFAETGPISLGNGDQTMNVMQLIPDEKTQGEVSLPTGHIVRPTPLACALLAVNFVCALRALRVKTGA